VILFAPEERSMPAMGWASWNRFGVNIDENVIKCQTDAMVSAGLATVGFEYINKVTADCELNFNLKNYSYV